MLTTDPGTGVIRHADAGYEEAIDCARRTGIRIPMLPGQPRRALSVPGVAAALVAALAAGPWPQLASASLLWRIPLAAAALAFGWRKLAGRWPIVAAVVLAVLALDAIVPTARSAPEFAKRVNIRATELQRRLGALAEDARLRRLLYPGGGEAEPEAPFELIEGSLRSLPMPGRRAGSG